MQEEVNRNNAFNELTAGGEVPEGTLGACVFAGDIGNKPREVESNWWVFFSDYRFREWRAELNELTEEQGISLLDICRYLGITYRKGIGFYEKLPKRKDMYIGIGMALKQPLETINQWIVRYGMKRKLYVKNLEEDLPWMYLICANYRDRITDRNYYKEYEACRRAAHETYLKCWEDKISADQMTLLVETDLQKVPYDEQYEGLRQFVIGNMDSFKTAYSKPRIMLEHCVQRLITAGAGPADAAAAPPGNAVQGSAEGDSPAHAANAVQGRAEGAAGPLTLNSLRGYLDDSMINYLSGSSETINVIDLKSGARTLNFKQIPKSKKAHISLALALGMSRSEIDRYLTMMGFSRLDAVDMEEGLLLNALVVWEANHPNPAARQMLQLRQDLQDMYRSQNREFPYLK